MDSANTEATVGAKKNFRCVLVQHTLNDWPAQYQRKKYNLETHGQQNAWVLQDAYYAPFIWNCYVHLHCLVFHDDVQEGSEGFPRTKKEALFPVFAQGG